MQFRAALGKSREAEVVPGWSTRGQARSIAARRPAPAGSRASPDSQGMRISRKLLLSLPGKGWTLPPSKSSAAKSKSSGLLQQEIQVPGTQLASPGVPCSFQNPVGAQSHALWDSGHGLGGADRLFNGEECFDKITDFSCLGQAIQPHNMATRTQDWLSAPHVHLRSRQAQYPSGPVLSLGPGTPGTARGAEAKRSPSSGSRARHMR